MSGNTKKIIAFNYLGSKFSYINNLYKHFPNDFIHLAEVFGGSAVLSLNYKRKCIITVNEINSDITNFFEVLRNNQDELIYKLMLTPVSKSEFDLCWQYSPDPVEKARRFYVRIRQSIFGLGSQKESKGWHMAKTKLNAKRGDTVSRWNNGVEKLFDVAQILRENLQITNYDYKEFIKRVDTSETFLYEDPPYVPASRASKNDYKYEFSVNDHIDLADVNKKVLGKVMISGYESELYDKELYKDWIKVKFPVKKNNMRNGQVQEVIWMNYEPSENNLQQLKFNL